MRLARPSGASYTSRGSGRPHDTQRSATSRRCGLPAVVRIPPTTTRPDGTCARRNGISAFTALRDPLTETPGCRQFPPAPELMPRGCPGSCASTRAGRCSGTSGMPCGAPPKTTRLGPVRRKRGPGRGDRLHHRPRLTPYPPAVAEICRTGCGPVPGRPPPAGTGHEGPNDPGCCLAPPAHPARGRPAGRRACPCPVSINFARSGSLTCGEESLLSERCGPDI